jgi:GTP cyclohydrolase I
VQHLIRELLVALGEDPDRPGLVRTPERVEKALRFFTKGYREELATLINGAVFEEAYNEMVLVKNIDFYSLCEHHMVPFFGKAHIAYIPNGRVIGLSKLARIVELHARRLQVQERLTKDVASTLQEALSPLGVGVVMEGTHMCMVMRGVEKANALTVTSSMLGEFERNPSTRSEFLSLIRAA